MSRVTHTSPALAGEVGERSETGEGGARGTTFTRVASAPRLGPLRGPSPQAGEVYTAAASTRSIATQHFPDRVYHRLRCGVDVVVPESHHTPPLRLQPRCPPRVIRRPRFRMLPAIQLDDQPVLNASEVDNKWSNGMLPAELPPIRPSTMQQKPKPTFDVRQVPPQGTCVLVRRRHNLGAIGKQPVADRTPLPLFAGEVEARGDKGESRAASTTLTRLATLADLGPLFTAQACEARET
jgi:hypothetical protein